MKTLTLRGMEKRVGKERELGRVLKERDGSPFPYSLLLFTPLPRPRSPFCVFHEGKETLQFHPMGKQPMTRTLRRGVLSWKPVKNLVFSLMSSLLLLVLFLEKCAEFVAKYCGVIRRSRPKWFSGQRITRQRPTRGEQKRNIMQVYGKREDLL